MADWLRRPGPAIGPLEALARVADAPALACLHGGGIGWSYLAWGEAAAPGGLAAAAALAAGGGAAPAPAEALGRAWSGGFAGGAVVQLDYEHPAAPAGVLAVDACLAWDPAGACTLVARDQAGIAGLEAGLARPPLPLPPPGLASPLAPAWDAAGHRERVERIRALIAAGDCYQVNLTLPFRARLAAGERRDAGLFAALARASPAPFAALLRLPGRPSTVSHSPECFLARRGGRVVSCPIKGTRRRAAGAAEALRGDAKERAELAMIVDLVRNDLGRGAHPGSVRVEDPARLIDLPTLHHLAADIAAAPRVGDPALIAGAFPPGSITGAPKARVMAIIRELEAGPRGPYCGAFGWLGRDGCELAVAIRTLVLDGDAVALHAGGGITADSDPAAEWDEVRAKAAAMAAALGGVA